MILLYLFCGGKLEDNLAGIFNLFDADGNKHICLKELMRLCPCSSRLLRARRTMWIWRKPWQKCSKADANADDVMDFNEFKEGMLSHPLTSKILREKTLDA